MASAERPQYTTAIPPHARIVVEGTARFACWTDRNKKSVKALVLPSGKCRRVVAARWVGVYRDHHGKKLKTRPFGDRSAALSAALALERRGRDISDGRIPEDDPGRDQGRAHLIDHVPGYIAHITGNGLDPNWIARVDRILRDKIARHGLTTPGKVNCERLQQGLERDRLAGDPRAATEPNRAGRYSIRTRNMWVTILRSYGRWLTKSNRIPANPFDGLSAGNAEIDRRRVRRALTHDQFAHLLDAARTSKVAVEGIEGPDRARLYLLAAYTGLRVGALARLTPEAFTWAAGRPSAVYSSARLQKNKSAHGVPLLESVGIELAKWLKKKKPGQPLWAGNVDWWTQAAKMIRHDLAAAEISYKDAAGQVFDFHALRGQFGYMLAAAGVPLVAAQQLLDHSSAELTAKVYSRFGGELAGEIAKLPSLGAPLGSEVLRTTPNPRPAAGKGGGGKTEKPHKS